MLTTRRRVAFPAFAAWITGRRTGVFVLVATALAAGGLIAFAGSTRIAVDPTAGLPSSAQSAQVARLQRQLPSGALNPAVVVYSREAGRLRAADAGAIAAQVRRLAPLAQGGPVSRPQFAPDRRAAIVVVPLPANVDSSATAASVKEIRAAVRQDLPPGVRAQVSGGAGFTADIDNAFQGADVTLLAATVLVVALLLLITYRSPLLWLVPLTVVAVADQVAAGIIAIVSRHVAVPFDQAVTGIVEVLVFGAGTNYALLLIARYREELERDADRRVAMRRAVTAAGPAILASGTTVILALLTLMLAELGGNAAIGIGGAIGIATALLFGLVVLPAALLVFPRGIFWPLVPRVRPDGEAAPESGRIWRRIGRATARRPYPVIVGSTLLLGMLALGLVTARVGLSQADTFRVRAESVDGLETLARAFPAGTADPVTVTTTPRAVAGVVRAAAGVDGVASARPGERAGDIAEVDVILRAAPATDESYAAIRRLRGTVAAVPGASARVGGNVAQTLDTTTAARRDFALIAPLILLIVFGILVVLLRALVAAALLIATVVLSFLAALGAASWAFRHVFDFAGLDAQVPLLSFLFLVALGVDYNIFLTTRTREESARVGTRAGVVEALAATGGVITSAGVLLAAVFTVLGVLPVIVLTEIGIIVGFGVLLDTLLVRTILVPALVEASGEGFWWPSRVRGDR